MASEWNGIAAAKSRVRLPQAPLSTPRPENFRPDSFTGTQMPYQVVMTVMSFESKDEACDFRDRLADAFCALDASGAYTSLTQVDEIAEDSPNANRPAIADRAAG
jgi:hypothetical protein